MPPRADGDDVQAAGKGRFRAFVQEMQGAAAERLVPGSQWLCRTR